MLVSPLPSQLLGVARGNEALLCACGCLSMNAKLVALHTSTREMQTTQPEGILIAQGAKLAACQNRHALRLQNPGCMLE